jgi:L-lactate dehydrogenase complex protein LldG
MTVGGRTSGARQEILAEIRKHLRASAPFDAVHNEQIGHGARLKSVSTESSTDHAASTKLERFRREVERVSGQCIVVRNVDEVAGIIERVISEANAVRVATSDAEIIQSVMARVESNIVRLDAATPAELFDCDIGVTSAQLGIAETGTLVLDSERERHRLISLIPPVHIAVLQASRICMTLGEALDILSGHDATGLSRAITFITGPSRTSDIELTLAIGVHGPQALHVIVLDDLSQ